MPDAHELTVTRYIAAPPSKVWNVMTERQEEWWCPKPWRAEFDRLDRHPGGDSLVHDVWPRRRSQPAPRLCARLG